MAKRSLSEAIAWLQSGANRLVMPMARYPDPILRMLASPVPETTFQTLQQRQQLQVFIDALRTTATTEGAVGLAASQLGVDARIIVLDSAIVSNQSVFINPEILERSPETDMLWWRERCLVLPPDVLVTLLRDARVTVKALNLLGHSHTETLSGEPARAFQHELDHLNGILIIDHATDDGDFTSVAPCQIIFWLWLQRGFIYTVGFVRLY